MSSKDEILTAIRQNTVQRYEYPDWEIKATVYPDKISRFYEISQFVGGKAVVLQEAEDINDIIRSHFPARGDSFLGLAAQYQKPPLFYWGGSLSDDELTGVWPKLCAAPPTRPCPFSSLPRQ